jgi:hypothetical protein
VSCFLGRVGREMSHGSQRFLRKNDSLRDHVRFFHEFFRFFVMQKDYHERFFGFFAFFTWGLQCLRLLDDFWGCWWKWCDDLLLFLGGIFRKKCVVGFFRKKSMYAFLWKMTFHKNFMDFIKILWNS